jgi:hypothetical protein
MPQQRNEPALVEEWCPGSTSEARRGGTRRNEVCSRCRGGAFLAVTQPYGIHSQLASLHVSHAAGGWTAMGQSALWLLEVAEAPGDLVVGISERVKVFETVGV